MEDGLFVELLNLKTNFILINVCRERMDEVCIGCFSWQQQDGPLTNHASLPFCP